MEAMNILKRIAKESTFEIIKQNRLTIRVSSLYLSR